MCVGVTNTLKTLFKNVIRKNKNICYNWAPLHFAKLSKNTRPMCCSYRYTYLYIYIVIVVYMYVCICMGFKRLLKYLRVCLSVANVCIS